MRHSGQHFCRSLQEAHDGIIGHTELVCGLDDLGMGESEIGNMGTGLHLGGGGGAEGAFGS